jgi:hypothetical protein
MRGSEPLKRLNTGLSGCGPLTHRTLRTLMEDHSPRMVRM